MTTDLRSWRCPHCDSANRMLAGTTVVPGTDTPRQVLGVDHERGCPDYIDVEAQPAATYAVEFDADGQPVVRLVDGDDDAP